MGTQNTPYTSGGSRDLFTCSDGDSVLYSHQTVNAMRRETFLAMTPTLKAVLARFDGNRALAIDYASSVARAYPRLANEYWQIMEMLRGARNE
jgi:hypothetical protein